LSWLKSYSADHERPKVPDAREMIEKTNTVKIHSVVNVSRVQRYKDQVEDQKKEWPAPVIIEEKEEYKVEKILNKKKFRGKDKYLI